MNELKTLKDFEKLNSYPAKKAMHDLVKIRELKAEAIKWVKFTLDEQKLAKEFDCMKTRMEQKRMNDGARQFIKHFFNLTKEDLK